MSSLPWLRLYTETLSDRKIKHISRDTKQPKPLIIGVWVSLLMLAGESPDRGRILEATKKPMQLVDIADELGIDEELLTGIIQGFINSGMVTIGDSGEVVITRWKERQFKSDDSTSRVKEWRAKKANRDDGEKGDVETDDYKKYYDNIQDNVDDNIDCNVSGNIIVTDQSQILIKNDDEKENNKSSDSSCDPRWSSIWQLWTNNIHLAEAPIVVQEMQCEEYLACPFEWWEQAVKIASKNRVFTWSYVQSILDRSIEAKESPDVVGPPKSQYGKNGKGQPKQAEPKEDKVTFSPSPELPPAQEITPEQSLWGRVLQNKSSQIPQWLRDDIKPGQRHNGTLDLLVSTDEAKTWVDKRLLDRIILPAVKYEDSTITAVDVRVR